MYGWFLLDNQNSRIRAAAAAPIRDEHILARIHGWCSSAIRPGGDAGLKVCSSRTHSNGDSEALHHLVAARANHMQADNALLGQLQDQLETSFHLAVIDINEHIAKMSKA